MINGIKKSTARLWSQHTWCFTLYHHIGNSHGMSVIWSCRRSKPHHTTSIE